jgi:hypothetical protein
MECKFCKFCELEFSNDGYGYCKIKLPHWLTSSTSTDFGAYKLVCVRQDSTDGCDLGQSRNYKDEVYLPTDPGFL